MKRHQRIIAGLLALGLCTTAACSKAPQPSESMSESVPVTAPAKRWEYTLPEDIDHIASKQLPKINSAPANLSDPVDVAMTYVWPLIYCGPVLTYSWQTPGDIRADDLVCLCAYNNPEFGNYVEVPAQLVETAIQEHFEVTGDYLKTSKLYRPETDSYDLGRNWTGGTAFVPTALEEREGNMIIEIGSFVSGDIIPCGTLTLTLQDGNTVRYLSYQCANEITPGYDENGAPIGPHIELAPVDLNDLDMVSKAYVWPLIQCASTLSYNWDSPSEIRPTDLIQIAQYNNLFGYPVSPGDGVISLGGEYVVRTVPAETLETVLRQYFDVTAEYLRTAPEYLPDQNRYALYNGWGGGWGYDATGAHQEGNRIVIEIGVGRQDAKTVPHSTLTIELRDGKTVRYLSNRLKVGAGLPYALKSGQIDSDSLPFSDLWSGAQEIYGWYHGDAALLEPDPSAPVTDEDGTWLPLRRLDTMDQLRKYTEFFFSKAFAHWMLEHLEHFKEIDGRLYLLDGVPPSPDFTLVNTNHIRLRYDEDGRYFVTAEVLPPDSQSPIVAHFFIVEQDGFLVMENWIEATSYSAGDSRRG